jgi:thioester reductase-like protein
MNRSKRLEDLSPEEKRALLADLLRNKATQEDASMAVGPMSVSELRAEAVLDPAIRPEGPPVESLTDPASIFLTGATGFLGAFLLHELLQQTQADIYCLVRSASVEEGKKRLQRTLESYSLWNGAVISRIIPVVGDMSRPFLGLSESQFLRLADQVDVVYHSGASVYFVRPYEALKAPNVLGTSEVLRLACRIKVKPVHHISTVGVFLNGSKSPRMTILEKDSIDDVGVPSGGYAQSKWVAEKLLSSAVSRGMPVCIYRPGWVSGHSKTGVWNTDDLLFRVVAASLLAGKVPDLDLMVNVAPVDYVSRAIVHLSRQGGSVGKAFHLVNPDPVHYGELIDWIRSSGYPLEQLPYDRWRAELFDFARRIPGGALDALLVLVAEWLPKGPIRIPEFDCRNTLDGLAGASILCPPLISELLEAYSPHFLSTLRLR